MKTGNLMTSSATAPPKVKDVGTNQTKPTNFGEDTLCPRDYAGKTMTNNPDDATYKELGGWSFSTGMRGDRD